MKSCRWIGTILLLLVIPIVFSCSVVFTGSITGSIVDRELYDNGSSGSGIAEAEIYLYTESEDMEADLLEWQTDPAILPETAAEGEEPLYFLKTITDDQGDYTFNGFIWNEFFPDYGKSGDRKEIFMLFYHEEYGLTKTAYPVYVVSDVTNRIPLFKLSRIMNTAEITGTVTDSDTEEPLVNANISIWIPETWTYSSSGSINTADTELTWNDSPSYTARTDDLGQWRQEITYPMLPSSTDNRGTTIVRVTYSANGYIAENAADSRITDGGWDQDGNTKIDADEDDAYFQSGEITSGSYADLGNIALADEYNTAGLTGRVINTNTGEGEANVTVRIWVAEDWDYNSSAPDDIEAAANIDWPENPDYSITTDADGEYSTDIAFERRPSDSDNRGTTRVRVVFLKNNFNIDHDSDSKLTDGGWDRDGNGTIDGDEADAYYDPADVIYADQQNDIGTIRVKQTEFSETLSGEVVDSSSGIGINGVEVWLFFTPDHDNDPSTPDQDTARPTTGTTQPTRKTGTTMELLSQDQLVNGYFSFTGLEWTDDTYTGSQSDIGYYIYLPTEDEIASSIYSGLGTPLDANLKMKQLTAGADNYISLEQ